MKYGLLRQTLFVCCVFLGACDSRTTQNHSLGGTIFEGLCTELFCLNPLENNTDVYQTTSGYTGVAISEMNSMIVAFSPLGPGSISEICQKHMVRIVFQPDVPGCDVSPVEFYAGFYDQSGTQVIYSVIQGERFSGDGQAILDSVVRQYEPPSNGSYPGETTHNALP